MRPLHSTVLAVAVALPVAAQQTVLYTLSGDSPGDALGSSAVALDDLDGDGVRDLAVGSPGDDLRQVRIFSGVDGAFLFALKGQLAGDGYGSSLAAVGDLDGDGVTELAIAAPAGNYVELVSLPTQTRLWTWSGAVTQVSRAGDVDADGTPDVLALQSGGGSSALVAISGASGTSGLTLGFPSGEWRFLDGGGDANGDGHADILLGNPFWPDGDWPGLYPGRARVHSGANGALLHEKAGSGLFDESYGWGVSWLDDLDGDGAHEFAIGAPNDIFLGDEGRVLLWSGASGAFHGEISEGFGHEGLGAGIADAGDLDGDGLRDLLVSRGPFNSELSAYSSASLQALFVLEFFDDRLDFPEPVIGVLDDVDGDGDSEVFSARPSGTPEGELLVVGQCETPIHSCVGAPNSLSASGSFLTWFGSTSVASNSLVLAAYGIPSSMPGLFLYSAGQQQTPFGNGFLCVGGGGAGVFRILPAVFPMLGNWVSLPLDFTAPPFDAGAGEITPGSTWHFQFWYRDTQDPPAFFNLSSALSVTFCP